MEQYLQKNRSGNSNASNKVNKELNLTTARRNALPLQNTTTTITPSKPQDNVNLLLSNKNSIRIVIRISPVAETMQHGSELCRFF